MYCSAEKGRRTTRMDIGRASLKRVPALAVFGPFFLLSCRPNSETKEGVRGRSKCFRSH